MYVHSGAYLLKGCMVFAMVLVWTVYSFLEDWMRAGINTPRMHIDTGDSALNHALIMTDWGRYKQLGATCAICLWSSSLL